MAIGVENLPNRTAPTVAYPNGMINDDPGDGTGTPINRNSNADIFVFFDKLLRLAGITANNTPDNETNGYQYIQALNTVFGAIAWTAGPTLNLTTLAGGGSVSGGTVGYNKYRIMGKTLEWQVRVTGLTFGSSPTVPTAIQCDTPSASNFPADGLKMTGVYRNGSTDALLVIALNSGSGTGKITLTAPGAFSSGSSNQDLNFTIIAELP